MTLDNLTERLRFVGKPMADVQVEALNRFAEKIGSKNTFFHEPLKSKIIYVEATVGEDNCFILHQNGNINHHFDENESNTFGMMVWYVAEECNIILAYF